MAVTKIKDERINVRLKSDKNSADTTFHVLLSLFCDIGVKRFNATIEGCSIVAIIEWFDG